MDANLLIFDLELTARPDGGPQLDFTELKVIDRNPVILDIFAPALPQPGGKDSRWNWPSSSTASRLTRQDAALSSWRGGSAGPGRARRSWGGPAAVSGSGSTT
jgi:hypothetical protein